MGDSCDTSDSVPVTYAAGWDFVCTQPGEHESLPCRVCGERMAADRGVAEATGWAHAMAIHHGLMAPRRVDRFRCLHAGSDWHRQALALRQEAERTPSGEQADRFTAEADAVVRTRAATKHWRG